MNIQLSERARVFASGLVGATIVSMLTFTVVEALSPENLLRRDGRADAPVQMAERAVASIMRA
jgi:hypothetical protein